MREGKVERRGREGAPLAQLPELQKDIKHNDPVGKETVRSSDVGTSQDFLLICSLVGARAVLPLLSPSFSLSATEAITPVQIQWIRCSPCPCCSPELGDLSVLLSNSSRTIKKILQLLWGWGEAGRQRETA